MNCRITNPYLFASGLQIRKSGRIVKYLEFLRICNPEVNRRGFVIPAKTILALLIFLLTISPTHAQKPHKFRVTGFVEYLNNTWTPYSDINKSLGFSNIENQSGIYNRFNFWYNPTDNLEFYVGMRNNFLFGPMNSSYNDMFSKLKLNYNYNELTTFDNGWIDLTFQIAGGNSYVFYTNFDRASLKWTLNKFELTIGRQRINWGVNLIWNPNDIFNAYNYFDFNYIERPGSDAVMMEYVTGDFSSVQLAGKIGNTLFAKTISLDTIILDKELKYTAAAMYRFNKWDYDFQFFAGVMEDDVTAGLGWAGSIAGAGFTGELSWFRDMDRFADTNDVWVASVAINYTFKNSIFINFSGIYNSAGATGPANAGAGGFLGSFGTMFSSSLNAKNLTRSRFDIFGQISYPATPLINLDLASIYNPYDKSVFVGPSITFSLTENISLMLVGQLFWGNQLTEFGDVGQMYFIDLKWSF
ncbi:MAG: hypothetical protein DRI72_05175 [Bacteroidetes bacterium]|nr:MAG: hypothetical protein DRI72_05175 [Bacteroidota bacterium]